MSKTFNTSTIQGLKAAERYKARLENTFECVHVYAIGLDRVQIVGTKPIDGGKVRERGFVSHANRNLGQAPEVTPDRQG